MSSTANTHTGEILFVGGNYGRLIYPGSWILNGNNWREISTSSPSSLSNPSVTFDPLTSRYVLFGGSDPTHSMVRDTWILDGLTWTKIPATAGGPVGRQLAAMAFDPFRGKILMQGGADGFGRGMSDTWSWDGTRWTQLLPNTIPTAAAGTMAMDWARRRIIFVTDGRHSSFFHMIWAWDGTDWSKVVTPTTPPHMTSTGGVVYDSLRARIVLITGCGQSNYELTATDWVKAPSIPNPQGLAGTTVSYDEKRHRVVAFSGRACLPSVLATQLWAYATPSPASTSTFGQACTSPSGKTPRLVPPPGSRPWIGDSFVLQITPNPQPKAAFMAFGLSKQKVGPFSLPMSLASLGAPGCNLLVDPNIIAAIPMAPELRWTLPIPNQINLAGIRFYTQALLLDPTYNQLGLITTNATQSVVGIR